MTALNPEDAEVPQPRRKERSKQAQGKRKSKSPLTSPGPRNMSKGVSRRTSSTGSKNGSGSLQAQGVELNPLDEKPQSFFTRLTFWWMNCVAAHALKNQLGPEHLPLPHKLHADRNFEMFQREWQKELDGLCPDTAEGAPLQQTNKKPPSLLRALWRLYGVQLCIGGLFKLAWSTLVIMGAFFFVRSLLQFVDPAIVSPYDSETAGIILVVCFFLDAWLMGLCLQRMGDLCLRVGIRIRAALVTAVAHKALSMGTVRKEQSAEIVAFVSSDINKVYDGIQQIHYLWTAPIEALTILALLAALTRVYALPGYVIVLFIVPLQYLFGYLIAKYKKEHMQSAAARVALAQEVLPAMKLVKYYCWEKFFARELNKTRDGEQATLYKLLIIRATNIALVFTTPPLTAFTVFTAYEFVAGKLSAELAFTTLSLFNIMRFPLVVLPKAIRAASEAWTSLKRVEEFLLQPSELKQMTEDPEALPGVTIKGGVFGYKESKDTFLLRVPYFEVRPGEVVGVAGRVGSGKTSVLSAILGYMETRGGGLSVHGKVAYVRQMPWIQNLTCKENILFGEEYDEERYGNVVRACALDVDFRILNRGENTRAGPRGINLSGGQRQRINLARAAYSDADVIILDSPLSAVDYHTTQHIFRHCIKGLFRHKAVLLITHSIDLLPLCDRISIMEAGRMVYFGPFSMTPINHHMPSSTNYLLEDAAQSAVNATFVGEVKPRRDYNEGTNTLRALPKPKTNMEDVVIFGEEASCAVGFRIPMFPSMRRFWVQGGIFLGILSLLLYILAQSSRQMSDYWVRQWANDTLELYTEGNPKNSEASLTYALTYMALMLAFGIFNWLRGFSFFSWTRRASNGFFRKYVDRTFQAPLAFFLNNPVGDLINVFSKDQDVMDENLPEALHFTGIYGLILLSTVVTVSIVIPSFSGFVGVLVLVSFVALLLYLPAATQLKYLTAESGGSATGLISEALEGLDVIQAYKKQQFFIVESECRTNLYHRYFFNSESLNLWLAFYCDFFGSILVLAVATFAVAQRSTLGAANVGLAFSNVIQMLVFYTWVIRFMADTISCWNSVERVSGLALNTPDEMDLAPPPTREIHVTVPPEEWRPQGGMLEFHDVWMRYKPNLPWALKGVSFTIQPKENIGVVGRTGSGKSTLLLVLYRMFELGAGRVIYDGIDISNLSRGKLRKALSIIPQEPLMFSGTLRANLDPYDEHPTGELWAAMEKVGLKEHVQSMRGGLEAMVDGTTSEWSLGQKQLLCLARAVLTKVPVLCLDEATASMDPQTEQLVLGTIDDLFEERTIVTIAHRLDIVIKNDKILLMEQGINVEMDTPDNLLHQPDSFFSMLVDRSAPTQAAALRHMAREAAMRRRDETS